MNNNININMIAQRGQELPILNSVVLAYINYD